MGLKRPPNILEPGLDPIIQYEEPLDQKRIIYALINKHPREVISSTGVVNVIKTRRNIGGGGN